jgi:hypothetical protein
MMIIPDVRNGHKALAVPGRPGVRVLAKQLGVSVSTVQRISASPFVASAAGVA